MNQKKILKAIEKIEEQLDRMASIITVTRMELGKLHRRIRKGE